MSNKNLLNGLNFEALYPPCIPADFNIGAVPFESARDNPRYDIEMIGADQYILTLSVPGYNQAELSVTLKNKMLKIKGARKNQNNMTLLYRGIVNDSFEKLFKLAESIKMVNAIYSDGLLKIKLRRIVSEEANDNYFDKMNILFMGEDIPDRNMKPGLI